MPSRLGERYNLILYLLQITYEVGAAGYVSATT
jgi:hypothetical protein